MESVLQSPDLFSRIKTHLEEKLPGVEAQYLLAPSFRGKPSVDYKSDKTPRLAGVCLLLFKRDNEVRFVLMRRNDYPGVHSGQISFPGGKKEKEDENLIASALRETEEEIGIIRAEINQLGLLTPIYIPPSNFSVTPLVAYVSEDPVFHPDPEEVKTLFEISILNFLNDAIIEDTTVNVKGVNAKVKCFRLADQIVWGATAIILSEFRVLLQNILAEENSI